MIIIIIYYYSTCIFVDATPHEEQEQVNILWH